MTFRQRILSVINGERPDRIPWVPRLEIWYKAHSTMGTLPAKYQGWTLPQIMKDLGVGHPARDGKLVEVAIDNTRIREAREDDLLVRTYITPVGEATEKIRINPSAKSKGMPFEEGVVEHLIKGEKDYRVVEHLIANTRYIPTFAEHQAYEEEIGDDGVPMTFTGWDPMFRILHHYIGYNRAYFELADRPAQVERLYYLLWEKQRELHELFIQAPTPIILHGAHYDSMMTPPPVFNKYMVPYFQELAAKLHRAGKKLAIHADADSRLLLDSFRESGIDMVECFCTAPMVSCTLEQALDHWGDQMVIWGGIPSTLVCPTSCSKVEFEAYLTDLFQLLASRPTRIILGVADNVMPEADISRIARVTELVEAFSPR